MLQTFKIQLSGQVQGVGFRPFVYNLAQKFGLSGTVRNDNNGVLIFVNGEKEELVQFLDNILEKAPDAAVIQSHSMSQTEPKHFQDFSIISSQKKGKVSLPLTADFVICSSCRTEVLDTKNRRFGYAFTTCTQCGPRYAITKKFPFERENTSMDAFAMCLNCEEEYGNPNHRRFHSQTNSCADCGIEIRLVDNRGESVVLENEVIAIEKAGKMLEQGAIIAIKNTNGYLLCADATNNSAVKKLRERKQRPTKPFALLYPKMETIKADFFVSRDEERALSSQVGPIVLLSPKEGIERKLASEVAPGLLRYGIMLPSSALLLLLTNNIDFPLVATSGNIHGSPILSDENETQVKLNAVADYLLHHNLAITFPLDDSVLQFINDQQIILRRSRGLAPNFMSYRPTSKEPILAMGAHLKSTLAFTPNGYTYVSPYFGNLDSYEVLQRYTETLQHYTQLFETLPEVILVDKHPSYQSTILGKEMAEKLLIPVTEIQHHKAHLASILAEHDLFDSELPILGVIWDGTGLGDDGMIWGGEFFTYDDHKITRVSHFEYFDYLAGDKMAKEPRLSLCSLTDNNKLLNDKFTVNELKIYSKLKANATLKTSSVGRLFDAVASLLDLIDVSHFEGEAAMLLEDLAWQYPDQDYIDFLQGKSFENIPTKEIFFEILSEKRKGTTVSKLAASFIYTLAIAILKKANQLKVTTVTCSGGVFQNRFLVRVLRQLSNQNKISILFHKELSSNDENIALGQLAYYEHINE